MDTLSVAGSSHSGSGSKVEGGEEGEKEEEEEEGEKEAKLADDGVVDERCRGSSQLERG